jgi:hypothetical protein
VVAVARMVLQPAARVAMRVVLAHVSQLPDDRTPGLPDGGGP